MSTGFTRYHPGITSRQNRMLFAVSGVYTVRMFIFAAEIASQNEPVEGDKIRGLFLFCNMLVNLLSSYHLRRLQ